MREFVTSTAARMPFGKSLLRMARTWRMRRTFGVKGSPEEVFSQYFRLNSSGDPESLSGPGSTIEYTSNLRRELPDLMKRLGVHRLLDAPCGDFNWFRLIRPDLSLQYIGGEIVADLVARNNAQYGDDRTSFVHLDITRDQLPAADLWLCRDVLFHLREREVFLAFDNFLRSDIRFLLTSSHPECRQNTDIPTGAFRPLNLRLSPYGLPEPQQVIDDWIKGWPVRHLCLWDRSQVERAMRENRAYRKAVASRQ